MDKVIYQTVDEAIEHTADAIVEKSRLAIKRHGNFFLALSGGSTPKPLYQALTKKAIDWSKVYLFWSDERNVPLTDPESNFKMAMDAGFKTVGIPENQIFPFVDPNAYEETIRSLVPEQKFDLVLLGMGDDGHTASLFPHTHALKSGERLAVANFIPEKEVWRNTLTFKCLNNSHALFVLVFGAKKASVIREVFKTDKNCDCYPIQGVHKAIFVMDKEAANQL